MLLDFEKPIVELETKLADMKQLAADNRVDVSEAVKSLEESINKLKRETYENLTRWQRVQLSRHGDRPYTLDYIFSICDQFIELYGDRSVKDDKAMVGGFGEIDGQTFMLIGQQKGRNTKQRQFRNFGMANPEGYRKALRLMKMAEKFNKPIITLPAASWVYFTILASLVMRSIKPEANKLPGMYAGGRCSRLANKSTVGCLYKSSAQFLLCGSSSAVDNCCRRYLPRVAKREVMNSLIQETTRLKVR
jgi:hypothetical protein